MRSADAAAAEVKKESRKYLLKIVGTSAVIHHGGAFPE